MFILVSREQPCMRCRRWTWSGRYTLTNQIKTSCLITVGLRKELISLQTYACMIGVLACSRERSGLTETRNMTFFPLNLASRLLLGPPVGNNNM